MAGIDWNIVGTVAGMGCLLTFVVVGIVAVVVWLIGRVIAKRAEPAKS